MMMVENVSFAGLFVLVAVLCFGMGVVDPQVGIQAFVEVLDCFFNLIIILLAAVLKERF